MLSLRSTVSPSAADAGIHKKFGNNIDNIK